MKTHSLGPALKFAWRYLGKSRPMLVCQASMIILMIAAQVLQPLFAGRFIDALTLGDPGASGAGAYDEAVFALTVFISLNVIWLITQNISMQLWAWLQARLMRDIVTDAFYKVQRFSTDWHNDTFAGATVRKITRGMSAFENLSDTIYFGFLPAGLVGIGIAIMLSWQWPVMGAFVAASIVAFIGWNYLLSTRWLSRFNALRAAADSELGATLADSITCNATVKAFAGETGEDGVLGRSAHYWYERTLGSWLRGGVLSLLQNLNLVFLQGGLLIISLWLWREGRASPGQVTLVLSSYFIVHGYLRDLGHHIRQFQDAVNDIADVVEIHKAAPAVADRTGAKDLISRGGEIVFDRITFRYKGQPEPLYDDFSLAIAPKEQVALVGRSGSGKSTFVKLIQRLYDLEAGEIRIDGQDIAGVTQDSLRRSIALVPQDPILFHRSLAENIAYARADASEAEILDAARKAHADEFIQRLPQGYDTPVGERGVKLSGGERQRIALARAFLADAPILILDEATSSLDSYTEGRIQDAIAELIKDRTTILIAHRLSTIQKMERILVFSEGSIIEEGSHKTLSNLPDGQYNKLHSLQREAILS